MKKPFKTTLKRILKYLMWIGIVAVFVLTFIYLYNNSKPKVKEYELVSPKTETIEKTTVLTGTIEPRDEIDIKPNISGIISELMVEAGDIVQAGQIIAKIKVVADQAQLAQAQNRINAAKIALDDVETRHKRNTQLFEKKVISREEFEATRTEQTKAIEELRAARDAYSIIKEGISTSNATETNTLVRATTSGLVLDVPVKVGTSVIQSNNFNDGTTIATIADMSRLIFKGTVDETEVGNLHVGQEMKITVGAITDLELTAELEFISPKSTSESGANTFEIKGGLLVPKDVSLRSGYSANATVTLDIAPNVMTVPESAVEMDGNKAYVYVLTDSVPQQKFQKTAVRTGLSNGIDIQILSGIKSNVKLRGTEKIEVKERAGGPPHR